MHVRTAPILAALLLAAACGGGSDGGDDPIPCVDEAITLSHTTTTAYACNEPYRTRIMITNGSCSSIRVQQLDIASLVTSCSVATCVASCANPPGSTTGLCGYPLDRLVPAKADGLVIDLTGDSYHYPAGGLSMVERYTYTVGYLKDGASKTISAAPVDVTVTLPQPCP